MENGGGMETDVHAPAQWHRRMHRCCTRRSFPSFRRLHSYSADVAGTPHGPTSTVGRTSIYNSLMGGAWSTQSPAIAWKQACSGEHSATGSHMPVAPVDTSGTSCCLLSRVALMMVRHNNHMMH